MHHQQSHTAPTYRLAPALFHWLPLNSATAKGNSTTEAVNNRSGSGSVGYQVTEKVAHDANYAVFIVGRQVSDIQYILVYT
ncbi:MAG: hypothetical protein OHK0029_03850 [Armatimonadaceae bacterium]